ncbi:MAG: flavin reductase family protein [Caldilineales bacterium]|nr:flavin reductase family protein [Caldilineales bacterium]
MRTVIDTGTYGEYLHYGLPLALVSVLGPDGRVNVSTNASITPLPGSLSRLAAGVLIDNYTNELIAKRGEFVVNLLTPDMRGIARQCGSLSGVDTDKLAVCGLTTTPAQHVASPLIEQCPVNIECRVDTVQHLDELNLWITRILAVHVRKDWTNGRGGVNLAMYKPLLYAFGHTFELGPMVGHSGI